MVGLYTAPLVAIHMATTAIRSVIKFWQAQREVALITPAVGAEGPFQMRLQCFGDPTLYKEKAWMYKTFQQISWQRYT